MWPRKSVLPPVGIRPLFVSGALLLAPVLIASAQEITHWRNVDFSGALMPSTRGANVRYYELNVSDNARPSIDPATDSHASPKSAQKATNRRSAAVPEASPFVDLCTDTGGDVFFVIGRADLTPSAMTALDNLGKAATQGALRDYNLQIEGHTCNIGTTESNLTLSEERAQSVSTYLVNHAKVEPDRIRSIGYGDTRPIVSNDDAEQRARNRRVRIVRLEKRLLGPAVDPNGGEAIHTRGFSGGSLIDIEAYASPHPEQGNVSARRLRSEGEKLASGSGVQFRVSVYEGCHLFVFLRDATNKVSCVFPDAMDLESGNGRWVDWRTEQILPSENNFYRLGVGTGKDTVFIIASRIPIKNISGLMSMMASQECGALSDPSSFQDLECHAVSYNINEGNP